MVENGRNNGSSESVLNRSDSAWSRFQLNSRAPGDLTSSSQRVYAVRANNKALYSHTRTSAVLVVTSPAQVTWSLYHLLRDAPPLINRSTYPIPPPLAFPSSHFFRFFARRVSCRRLLQLMQFRLDWFCFLSSRLMGEVGHFVVLSKWSSSYAVSW